MKQMSCKEEKLLNIVTMAKPTSAFLRAGPSLVPSPVTATTCRVSPTVLSMIPDQETNEGLVRLSLASYCTVLWFGGEDRTFDKSVFICR